MTRLSPHIDKLIHWDQVRFVPIRKVARDGITRAINLVHSALSKSSLALSREKAFDRVDLTFLTCTLKHAGLGSHMLNCVLALYPTLSARFQINGTLLENFHITNGPITQKIAGSLQPETVLYGIFTFP